MADGREAPKESGRRKPHIPRDFDIGNCLVWVGQFLVPQRQAEQMRKTLEELRPKSGRQPNTETVTERPRRGGFVS